MRDRLLLAALKTVPASLAEHVMFLLRSNAEISDRWGHHIRPIHWGEPLPDFREITVERACERREPSAIEFDLDSQLLLQARLGRTFGAELDALAKESGPAAFPFLNGYFDGLDAAVYYALIRELKPRRIIEIGSGFSTRIAARAVARNLAEGSQVELICVEPFPEPRLTDAALPMTLVRERVERVPLAFFESLQPNDLLLIDSSHVARFGGDVTREFLEILPGLQQGVWVHVHDIFFPHDYPADWLMNVRHAWNEQYFLEAFLKFNRVFAPAFAAHWLWSDYRRELDANWPSSIVNAIGPQGPASFWMTRVA
jgi:hypothetical protein